MNTWILRFCQINKGMIAQVDGENASLGEMFNRLRGFGVHVPDGFALTTEVYREFIRFNQLERPIRQIISILDTKTFANLASVSSQIRALILPNRHAAGVGSPKRLLVGLRKSWPATQSTYDQHNYLVIDRN